MTKLKLHDYQVVARDHLLRNDRGCLFLDMGLGKTAITLAALRPEQLPALVVAPKRVAETVWPAEQVKWRPDLTLALAAGPSKDRLRELAADKDIVVLGRDNIRDAIAVKRKDNPFKTIIIDELSGFKGRGARWRAARSLVKRPATEYVWGLSGTPAPNGLLDLWAQMALIDGGQRLGKTLTEYRGRYFRAGRQLPNGIVTEWILRDGSDKMIHELLDDVCLSMETEGRIKLPPVTFNEINLVLPPAARKAYKDMKKNLVADLDLLGGEIHSASGAAMLSNRLSQISAGFMYVDDADLRDKAYDVVHREKTKAVREIVDGTGSPVLVFYRYTPEADWLKEEFGDDARMATEPGVIDDWNAGRVPVMLAHPLSAGHGLNLQHGGHTAVWTTLPWSLEEWEQSNKRLARQGQLNPVIIHLLMMKKTIDPLILERLHGKADVQGGLLDHLESPI